MVIRMRETQKRRTIAQIRQRQEPLIIESIAAILDSRYRWLKRDLRDGGNLRKRLSRNQRMLGMGELRKANEVENWAAWNKAFTKQMGEIFKPYINAVAGVENQYFVSKGYQPRPLDADTILEQYSKSMLNSKFPQKNKSFAQLATDIENNSVKLITDWFKTDAPITKLFADLAPIFGRARAELIARTEATGLASRVSLAHYAQLHIELFNVDLGDEVGPWPCGICTGKADENPHSIWTEMPPFHPDCRCGTTPANADGSDLVYGQEPDEEVVPEAEIADRNYPDIGAWDILPWDSRDFLYADVGKALVNLYGDTSVQSQVMALKAAGIPEGWKADFNSPYKDGSYALQINANSPDGIKMERILYRNTDGKYIISNEDFEIPKRMTGKGLGSKMFFEQATEAAVQGWDSMETIAGGDFTNKVYNGYYTWPRLGYDGDISVITTVWEKDWGEATGKTRQTAEDASKALGYKVVAVSDLMKTQEGRDWWWHYGTPGKMIFDLSTDGQSMRVLNAYATAKGYK